MKDSKENGVNAISASAYDDFLKKHDLRKILRDSILFVFVVMVVMFVSHVLTSPHKDTTSVILEKPSPITTEKVLKEELTFKVAGPVKPVEGVSALPIGSVLVEGKNPNPDERDVVVNAQVIPLREIPVGTEVIVHIICDQGIWPQSFFYLMEEK